MRIVLICWFLVLSAGLCFGMEDRWALEENEEMALKPLLMAELYSSGFVVDAVPMNDFSFYGRSAITGEDLRSGMRVILRGEILITELISDEEGSGFCDLNGNQKEWDVAGYSGGNLVGRWIGKCLSVDVSNRVSFYDVKTSNLITYSGPFIANEVPE